MTAEITVPADAEGVALLDLEGTLLPDRAVWERINRCFGLSEQRDRELYRRHLTGGSVDREGWAAAVAEAWSRTGEATRQALEEALDRPAIPSTSRALIEELHDRDVVTLLVSGSPDRYSRRLADRLGVRQHVPTISITFDSAGAFDSLDMTRYVDKGDLAHDLAADGHKIWAFGNGHNDVEMVAVADRGFMVPNRDGIDYGQIGAEPVERSELPRVVGEGDD